MKKKIVGKLGQKIRQYEEKNEWDYLERYNDRVNLDDIFFHKKELGKSIKSLVKNFIIQNYKHLSLDVLDWNDYDEFL